MKLTMRELKLKELAMNILSHGICGISVEYSNFIDEDNQELEVLTIFEYEEPRTAWRTVIYNNLTEKEIDYVEYNGDKRSCTPLDYYTFDWGMRGPFLHIFDSKHHYEFDLGKISDIIIA